MLKGFLNRLKGPPEFYGDLRQEQVGRYQHYFMRVLTVIDVDNNTKWAQSKSYDKQRLHRDDALMENIIVGEATKEGLSPAYLQIIVNQYFLADPYEREKDKNHWVARVLQRKSTDYFPDPWATRKLLESFNG
jgi:hypothetical protein